MSRSFIAFLLMFALCTGLQAGGKKPQPVSDSSRTLTAQQEGDGRPPRDPIEVQQEKERQKSANMARQTSLQKDTDKLLQLAQELKASVDKSNENTLSLQVIKKAEEIEKLAHNVKEKMRATGYEPGPGLLH